MAGRKVLETQLITFLSHFLWEPMSHMVSRQVSGSKSETLNTQLSLQMSP